MNPELPVLTVGSMYTHNTGYNLDMNKKENIKQAKGNECSQYKRAAAIFSSSLPICSIHIFSSDTEACFALATSYNTTCFALVTSHNMPSNMLHTPLYAYCVHNVHNMDSKHA